MAAWSLNQHLANAAVWALIGTYVIKNYGQDMNPMIVHGVLALAYSYGIELVVS